MEDWLHFVTVYEAMVFQKASDGHGGDVLTPQLRELWEHLVAVVTHYCRPTDVTAQRSPETRQQAAQHNLIWLCGQVGEAGGCARECVQGPGVLG